MSSRTPEGRALLEDALRRGARVRLYEGENSGNIRLPGSGAIMFVSVAEVIAAYRRLVTDTSEP